MHFQFDSTNCKEVTIEKKLDTKLMLILLTIFLSVA